MIDGEMMRRALIGLGAAAALALAACGGDEDDSSSEADASSADATLPSTSAAASTSAEPTGPPRSPRGNIIKQLGEEGGITASEDSSAPLVLTFAVDSIAPDPPCNSGFASAPVHGHYVAIDLRVATTPEWDPNNYVTFTEYDFAFIGPDGLTVSDVSGNAYSCLDDGQRFTSDPIGAAQQYAGTVVIDVPATTGTLLYLPQSYGGTSGWEWTF